uniref:Uncharacterized protein n=1 Tax=Arundo donax TaxID=35708 RepID=A0A0A8Y4Z6_ARUDO
MGRYCQYLDHLSMFPRTTFMYSVTQSLPQPWQLEKCNHWDQFLPQ